MSRSPIDRFENQWRHEAQRPPATPPGTAATRVRARIVAAERRRRALRMAWATAAVVGMVMGALLWLPTEPTATPGIPVAATAVAPPPLGEDVVLLWLDADTPLYLTLTPPTADRGDST